MGNKIKQYFAFKNKKGLSITSMIFLMTLAMAYIVGLYIISNNEMKNINKIDLANDVRVSVNDGKEEKGDLHTLINKIDIKRNDEITIKIKIPKNDDILNPVISSITWNNPIVAYIKGKKVFSFNEDAKNGEVLGTEVFKIPIDEKQQGKDLKIVTRILDKKAITTIKSFYYINTYDADVINVRKEMVNIYISNYIYIFGIICILFNFGGFWKHNEAKREIYIALISIAGALWIVSSGVTATFYGVSAKVKYFLEYEALYAMCYFMFVLFYDTFRTVKQRRYLKLLNYTVLSYIVVVNILRLLKIIYFQEVLIIFHVILLIGGLLYYYISFRNYKKYKEMFALYTVLVGGLILFMLIYNSKITPLLNGIGVATLTIFVLGIYMFISLINGIKVSFMDKIEREALLNKVYEDKLTKLNNRRSCEYHMKKIDTMKDKVYLIYSFDINGLKIVNDKYGHEEGDKLIVAFSDALKKVFCDENNEFVGRMGGDEFFVAQNIVTKDVIDEKLKIDELKKYVNDRNELKEDKFSIEYASGWSICDKNKGDKVWETYNRADKDMYDFKRKMKEKKD